MNNKNIVNTNNSSSQKDGFINNIRNLLVLNQNSQIPTYEGLKVRMQTIIDTAKTIYRNLANVLPEIENHISAGKLISTMYLKIHEMMIESKNAHIRDYIVKEKKILKIRKLALKIERKCRKCLFILYDLIQSTKILIIPNYEKIETLHNELENMYSLRPRSAIYYGEEDGNFDDPTDADYNPSDDQDDEEFNFDEYDNDSEYDPSDDEENDDEEFDFDEADEEEDEDDDSDYDYEDEDEYSTEDAEFMDEYNNDPEYLLDEDEEEDEEEEFDFDQDDDNDSEYTPSEADEDEEEFDFDEVDDNDSDYTPSEADEDDEEYNFDEEDDNDSDYNPDDDADDADDEEFEFDEEDEEEDEDEDEEYEEQADEEDRQFISDYLNDPDYNPDEDDDEEDELEYDFSFLNKKVDEDGNIVLKAGIADDNDEEDPDYDPTDDEHDEDDENDEDIKYVNNKNILNICKRRFENGKVVYRWVKMTKEQAEKKYDEDYDCEEN